MNILLIAGGWSEEREVALNGAKKIYNSLEKLGHKVSLYDPVDSLDDLLEKTQGQDFAFINLHGSPGEDGLVQAMLDSIGLPYQGSGPAASYLALNKAATKAILRHNKLPTPNWILLNKKPEQSWLPPFAFPAFLKCNDGGSSLDLERVATKEELPAALERLFKKERSFIMEPLFEGLDVTCPVLGELKEVKGKVIEVPVALPCILIKPKKSGGVFFDYESKYSVGGADEICPAPIAEEITQQMQAYALKLHQLLGLSGYSRTDFLLSPNGKITILEINTLPGMTATSLVPQSAAVYGLDFEALLTRLIKLGLHAAREKQVKIHNET